MISEYNATVLFYMEFFKFVMLNYRGFVFQIQTDGAFLEVRLNLIPFFWKGIKNPVYPVNPV